MVKVGGVVRFNGIGGILVGLFLILLCLSHLGVTLEIPEWVTWGIGLLGGVFLVIGR